MGQRADSGGKTLRIHQIMYPSARPEPPPADEGLCRLFQNYHKIDPIDWQVKHERACVRGRDSDKPDGTYLHDQRETRISTCA